MEAILYLSSTTIVASLVEGFYQKSKNAVCVSKKRLDGKTAIVTGGTAGIGLEVAKDFAERGARVIIACPYADEGEEALKIITEKTGNEEVFFMLLDLSSLKSVREFAADIIDNERKLDILINNAGVGTVTKPPTEDGMNYIMQVNYYGHFLLTLLLLPLLKKSGTDSDPSRIVNTSSMFHLNGQVNIDKLNEIERSELQRYADSKLFLILFAHHLSKKLNSNVVINSADPGPVGTKIFGTVPIIGNLITWGMATFFKTPWEGAQTTIHVALDKEAGTMSGKVYNNCTLVGAKPAASDDKIAESLWQESLKLVKLSDEELEKCFQ